MNQNVKENNIIIFVLGSDMLFNISLLMYDSRYFCIILLRVGIAQKKQGYQQ